MGAATQTDNMPVDSLEDINSTAVIGAGEMGRGIAAVQALAGYRVTLHDIDSEQLTAAKDHIAWSYSKAVDHNSITPTKKQTAEDRLAYSDSLTTAVEATDLVTEAVVEQQDVKADIFRTLDDLTPTDTVLATNTSGLNITRLAELTSRPERVLGTHWFNPPMLMDLVEVILTDHTSLRVAELMEDFIHSLDKTPIRCKRDIPLFIVNRLMRPYGEAAAWLVYYDEASIKEIDSAMKYRENFPMGPFELADYTGGIQIRVESEPDHLADDRPLAYDTRYCQLLHEKYEQGQYGRKSGQGFYDYSVSDTPEIPREAGEGFNTLLVWGPVINEAAKLVQHDIASIGDVDTGAKLGGNWPVGPFEKADALGLSNVVDACVQVAHYHGKHDEINMLAETLPCDFLIQKAKANTSFN